MKKSRKREEGRLECIPRHYQVNQVSHIMQKGITQCKDLPISLSHLPRLHHHEDDVEPLLALLQPPPQLQHSPNHIHAALLEPINVCNDVLVSLIDGWLVVDWRDQVSISSKGIGSALHWGFMGDVGGCCGDKGGVDGGEDGAWFRGKGGFSEEGWRWVTSVFRRISVHISYISPIISEHGSKGINASLTSLRTFRRRRRGRMRVIHKDTIRINPGFNISVD